MDGLFELLFAWCWYGADGRTETADAAEKYLLPVLLLISLGSLVGLCVYSVWW